MPRTLALVLVLLSAPSLASAQSAEQRIDAIRELIQQARFGDAVDGARALLDQPSLSAFDRNSGLEVLAIAQVANRQRAEAAETLTLLYARDPGHRLSDPDASPPVISAFARAREAHPDRVPVRIEHQPPQLTVREPPQLLVHIAEGADAVSEVQLRYRVGGEGEARVVMTPRDDGTFSARIPVVGDASSATDVSYYVTAMAPSLSPLATMGSEAEPLQLRIPAESSNTEERPPVLSQTPVTPVEEDDDSLLEQWWFWTLIAALVVGGVTLAVVLGTQQSPEEGTLGSVRLMQVEW